MSATREEMATTDALPAYDGGHGDQDPEPEGALFDLAGYYGALVIVFVVVGALAGMAVRLIIPPEVELTTLVIERGTEIGPFQQGTLSKVIFRSEAVYGPAMRDLGLRGSPANFYDHVDLRPVPGANALLVAGRGSNVGIAKRFSAVAARWFVAAYGTHGFSYGVIGTPQRSATASSLSPRVAGVIGGTVAFWLAVSFSLAHYRARRPVLSLRQALAICRSERAAVAHGRWTWLGFLHRPSGRDLHRNRMLVQELQRPSPGPGRYGIALPRGLARHTRVSRPWTEEGQFRRLRSAEVPAVLVCPRGITEDQLMVLCRQTIPADSPGPGPAVLWLR
jgi:hypothetical protein